MTTFELNKQNSSFRQFKLFIKPAKVIEHIANRFKSSSYYNKHIILVTPNGPSKKGDYSPASPKHDW